MDGVLAVIESYYDAVPRSAARVESLGPFTLFVNDGAGWPYYARPALGASSFAAADLARVRNRQRSLAVPEALEWVGETTPGLTPVVAEAAGLVVHDHPLLVLSPSARSHTPCPLGLVVRLVTAEDDLASLGAVGAVAFASRGTAVGKEGMEALKDAAGRRAPEVVAFEQRRLKSGTTIMAAAFVDGQPVSVGSHQPVGAVSEIVGVATLPAYRRRGIAAAVTNLLIEDALARGLETIFLSADDSVVAGVYERLGFRKTATAYVAEAV